MTNSDTPSIHKIRRGQRKSVSVSQEALVQTRLLQPDQPLPFVIEPVVPDIGLTAWATENRDLILTHLRDHGGILFRGFNVHGIDDFQHFIKSVGGDMLEYAYRSTPRNQVSGKIYTSTEYPADQWIPMHNEMSYSRSWPMKIGFFSIKVAEDGGETPIVDSRKVFDRIPSDIRDNFRQKQVMYIRNYGEGLDLPWENVFQTDSKAEVEAFCRDHGIEFEWKDGNRLRTWQICQAVVDHPDTNEPLWFNQAHLFHISNLPAPVQESLLSTFGDHGLPRNACYGDGSTIESEALDAIRAAYAETMVLFPWQMHDVLLLDNMLVAHGRAPFTGTRKVVVGMAETMSS